VVLHTHNILSPIDDPINHQVHSTTYVEDFDNILIAKSKKKILIRDNLCNNENKVDVMSCVLIGSILLKIEEPKDHVMVPQGFLRVHDTFLLGSTWPQVHPITKSQGMESSSLAQIPVWVQLGIQEQSCQFFLHRQEQSGQDCTFQFQDGLVNYKAQYDLS
jgi:hypothetical protein